MEFLGVLSKLFVSFYYHPVTEENQIPFTLTLTPQLTVFLHYGLSNTQRHKVVVLWHFKVLATDMYWQNH
jgi:hypothetical protein